MAGVIWAEPALQQLDAIASYIALDKPEAAQGVVRRIFEATDRLNHFKKIGRKSPEFPHRNYRQVWIHPCWIYYRIDGDTIRILHVRRAERPLNTEDLADEN